MTQIAKPTGMLVLVVEDDPATLRAMVKLMKMCGHATLTAETVSEGLQRLLCHPTHVFLDMNLPDGKGTTILSHIRTTEMTTRVAVLSGTTDEYLLDEASGLLADVIFIKPANVGAITAWMGEATGNSMPRSR